MKQHTVLLQQQYNQDKENYVRELQKLLACYQLASLEDRKVVWAALDKYSHHVKQI